MADDRAFDITILGATGWTATICAQHIARTLPTNLRWCIAGRSPSKLEALAADLRRTNPDRPAPRISVLPDLSPASLEPLARSTRVLINGVGPYHRYSTPVVAACAGSGTHYADFTTETRWVADMVAAYDAPARSTGAILIPSISLSSAPSDLVAWLVAREAPGLVREVAASGALTMLGMQGGSAETVLGVAERYGVSWFWAPDPWALSPQARRRPETGATPRGGLAGYRFEPALGGALAPSFVAASNEVVVQRSAGLDPELYGAGFVYREYVPASGRLGAALIYLATKLGILLLALPWFRALVRAKIMFEPGTGPDREESRSAERADFRAVGFVAGREEPVLRAEFKYQGALTDISAILAVEAAAVLLEISRAEGKEGAERRRGGLLTPSTLGLPFVERLRKAGVELRVERLV
ncbi:hypothetical protein F5X99DRAFT_427542 [Biscogniauxia marginata]|nr:hypothetical protein F5X99DRAFT_427542 [Biscogniauxia marginata]